MRRAAAGVEVAGEAASAGGPDAGGIQHDGGEVLGEDVGGVEDAVMDAVAVDFGVAGHEVERLLGVEGSVGVGGGADGELGYPEWSSGDGGTGEVVVEDIFGISSGSCAWSFER